MVVGKQGAGKEIEVDVRPNEGDMGARQLEPGVLEAARVEVLDVLEERSQGGIGLLVGRIACVLGLGAAVVGLIGLDISPEAVGIALGITGYALGARGLGTATVAVSTVLLLVVLAIGVGEVPGIAPSDPIIAPGS